MIIHITKKCIDLIIEQGWLEEVVDKPQSMVQVVKNAYKHHTEFGVVEIGDELARKIATAAVDYAVEVSEKAISANYQAFHPQAQLIIQTLKQESELNKTKEV